MYITANGVQVHVEKQGDETAPMLVLAHPLMSTLDCWKWTIPNFLQKGYQVLTYDQIGHGDSEVDSNTDMDSLVNVLKEVINQASGGAEIKAVVGCSLGAVVCAKYSMDTGTPAVIVSIPGLQTNEGAIPAYKDRIQAAENGQLKFELALATMQRWFKHNSDINDKVKGEMTRAAQLTKPEGYVRCLKALMDYKYDVSDLNSTKPLLIAGGSDDPGLVSTMQSMANDLEVQLHVVEKTGHVLMAEKPDEFANLVLSYL